QATRLDRFYTTDYAEEELHDILSWFVRVFDQFFSLQLPFYPLIRFAELTDSGPNAYYQRETRNGVTTYAIVFNTTEFDRPLYLTLRTLLHECLHVHCEVYGLVSDDDPHGDAFRAKALDCGLYVDEEGITQEHTIV